MKPRIGRYTVALGLFSLELLAAGGCPMTVPPPDDAVLGLAPGVYYVQQSEGKLFYYELAQVRGEDDRWVELSDDGEWFTGPAFYRLSEDYVWSRDEDVRDLTLDELIQLHDPAPRAPETAL